MRVIFVLIFCLQFITVSSQDTTLYRTSGILVYKYDKEKLKKEFFRLKHRLRKKEKIPPQLTDDLLWKNDNFFINGAKQFNRSHVIESKRNEDSLFIWHYSDYYGLVYLLEKEMGIKFPAFSEGPCISVPYIFFREFPKVAYRMFSVNCTFIEVNILVDNEELCNRLNGTSDFVKFSVGKSYKLFILHKIDRISSYLENVSYDRSIKILKIPVL